MNYAYYRVSTDKQDYENQKYGVVDFCRKKQIKINKEYVDEVSGTVDFRKRELGKIIKRLKKGDILVCSEISRLGRKILMIMEVLQKIMEKGAFLYTVKENYELGDNITSKVLAFAFGLSAEIERDLISQRTKEALKKAKEKGIKIGRPKGSTYRKLKKREVVYCIKRGYNKAQIAREFCVDWNTVHRFINERIIIK